MLKNPAAGDADLAHYLSRGAGEVLTTYMRNIRYMRIHKCWWQS